MAFPSDPAKADNVLVAQCSNVSCCAGTTTPRSGDLAVSLVKTIAPDGPIMR
jgi:hypothetical protein